jgi:Family of unknown function (DUF5675)
MKITVVRTEYTDQSTAGVMLVDGDYFGVTLEDCLREGEKINGKTCIPSGRYKVEMSFSNRFQKMLPILLSVPNFEGVRIHGGNTADDTLGCILVGSKRVNVNRIMESASMALVALLQKAGGKGEIEIINAWRDI